MSIHLLKDLPSLAGLRKIGEQYSAFPFDATQVQLAPMITTAYGVAVQSKFTDGQNEGSLIGATFSESDVRRFAERIWRAGAIVSELGSIRSLQDLCQLLKRLQEPGLEYYFTLKVTGVAVNVKGSQDYEADLSFFPTPHPPADKDYIIHQKYSESGKSALKEEVYADLAKIRDDPIGLTIDAGELHL
jgi:hypothetical protein